MKYYQNKKFRLFRDPQSFASSQGYIATIGNYDGVHLGHQYILQKIQQQQQILSLPSLIIIFEPSPLEYFLSTHAPARISTLHEKVCLLSKYKIENILCLKFNAKLATMPASQFIQKILIDILNIKYLIVGYDFSFGHNRNGNFDLLKKYSDQGLITEKIEPVYLSSHKEQFKINSTHVRQALANANFELATKLLGRPYAMCGRVVHGNSLGKRLGFPSANICLKHKILPLKGVYAAKIQGQSFGIKEGIVNIGTRPTINGKTNILESHIFDFDKNIYGEKLIIEFLHKIRQEQKFDSLELLQQQVIEDIKQAKKFFN